MKQACKGLAPEGDVPFSQVSSIRSYKVKIARMKRHIILVIGILLLSCGKTNQSSEKHVDVLSSLKTNKETTIQQIADRIEIIELETNDNCLLPNRSHIVSITDQGLVISGGGRIFLFSKEGKFLRNIGVKGSGHNEYQSIKSMSVSKKDGIVALLQNDRSVIFYNLNGELVKKVNFKSLYSDVKSICHDTSDIWVAHVQNHNEQGVENIMIRFDSEGDILGKYPFMDTAKESTEEENRFYAVSILYKQQEKIIIREDFGNTLSALQDSNIHNHCFLDAQEANPPLEIKGDVRQREYLYKNYATCMDAKESDRYWFLIYVYKNDLRTVIIDKKDYSTILSAKPKKGMRSHLGINLEDETYFWPTYAVDSVAASLVHKFDEGGEEENPSAYIVYLKK